MAPQAFNLDFLRSWLTVIIALHLVARLRTLMASKRELS